jgi:hypothetical protein
MQDGVRLWSTAEQLNNLDCWAWVWLWNERCELQDHTVWYPTDTLYANVSKQTKNIAMDLTHTDLYGEKTKGETWAKKVSEMHSAGQPPLSEMLAGRSVLDFRFCFYFGIFAYT